MPCKETNKPLPNHSRAAHPTLGVVEQHALPSRLANDVLAALPSGIAALDRTGTVVAINDAWRRFACETGSPDLAEGSIGLHYREVLRREFDLSRGGAEDAPASIQAVLEGALPEFRMEYQCQSPSRRRWFTLRAVPLPEEGGALISRFDITGRKLAEEQRAHLLAHEQAARVETERHRQEADAARAAAEAASRRLEQLLAVTDAALGHLALADLLPALSDRICQVMAVDDVSIFLLTEDKQALTLHSARGVFAGIQARIPLGQGVVGRIAASRQPLIIDDLSTAEVVYSVLCERLHSLIGVPLLVEGNLVGVLHMGTTTPRHFTEADVHFLQLAGERIALALERARLYEEAQKARQEAEARASELDATFEAMADGVLVYDREQHVVRANRAYRDLMAKVGAPGDGATPSQEWTALLAAPDEHGQTVSQAQWPLPRLLRGEVLHGAATLDVRVRTPDGEDNEFNVGGAPVRDAQGQITGAVAVVRDVTERRRLERRTHEALDALLAMARALVGVDDGADGAVGAEVPGGDLVAGHLAEAARRVLGCERVALIALDPETERLRLVASVGFPPEIERQRRAKPGQFRLADYLPAPLIAQLQAGAIFEHDLGEAARRGLPTYDMSRPLVAPLRLGTDLVGVLAVDYGATPHALTVAEQALLGGMAHLAALVLQRERLSREREEARADELALRETTERMNEFIATASHDLRTPLATTVGFIDLAARMTERLASALQGEKPDLVRRIGAIRGWLDDASQSGQRLSRLVSLLFDTTLIRAGKLELHPMPCDLAALMREQVAALGVSAPHRTIRLKAPADEPVPVMADADRLGQVVANYLNNALKYSPDDQPVEVRVAAEGTRARVSVEDHGPGLPPSEQERIWQPFYRAADVGVRNRSGADVGLGMGLHISKAIVERHGGQVGVDSAVGRGSTFWFTLPLAE